MGFVAAVKTCFRKYFTFSGRASRSEFWYWWLFTMIVQFVFDLIGNLSGASPILLGTTSTLVLGVSAALWIPSITVMSRRLHDIGRSGWWQLLALGTLVLGGGLGWLGLSTIPAVIVVMAGAVVLFVWTVRRGTPGDNRFGPDPLAQAEETAADAAFAGE